MLEPCVNAESWSLVPNPGRLSAPIESWDMAVAVVTIASEWLDAAHHDPTWLVWLGQRQHHAFVIQTLCRLLYSLATTEVTSKLHAIQWAQHTLDAHGGGAR